MRVSLFFMFCSYLPLQLVGQPTKENNRALFNLQIHEAIDEIHIDGRSDEQSWKKADVAKNFIRITPIDTGFADSKTEVQLTYDQQNIYVLVKCIEDLPGKNTIASLRRDFSFGRNDNFIFFFDTFNDQTNGFSFGMSAANAQWDGIQSDGGRVSLDWDCKWQSTVKHYDGYWIGEMAIPFRNLKYQKNVDEWGINFSRLDLKRNEKSSWAPVPRQFPSSTLAFTGTLVWDKAPPVPKTNVSFIPYVAGDYSEDIENNEKPKYDANAGIDLKAAITPTLNLDLTLNPDFSQVDVDQQVTNLDRFELFFPERRRFFLENQDVFSGFGKQGLRPFFSRRIGLENPVVGGLRLSGKLDQNWRVGLLNMQTSNGDSLEAANYTVASLQRKVFSRSYFGVFGVNKNLMDTDENRIDDSEDYNRVLGVDFNLASANNRWLGKTFYHKSFRPDTNNDNQTFSTGLEYNTEQWETEISYDNIGSNYLAETGFVRRTGIHRMTPRVEYKHYVKAEKIINHGPEFSASWIYDRDFDPTDREFRAEYNLRLLNTSQFEIGYNNQFIRLLDSFDPTNTDGDTLATGEEFRWSSYDFEYKSDRRKIFNYQLNTSHGGFFNGHRSNYRAQVNYRFQPYGSIGLTSSYDQLTFDEPFEDVNFLLIGTKVDVTFTTQMFLTAWFQYNEQADNINTNIRFQWRYAPVSDLFIVYTDNHLPTDFGVKNRSLVLKMTYWFN